MSSQTGLYSELQQGWLKFYNLNDPNIDSKIDILFYSLHFVNY